MIPIDSGAIFHFDRLGDLGLNPKGGPPQGGGRLKWRRGGSSCGRISYATACFTQPIGHQPTTHHHTPDQDREALNPKP